MQRDEQRHSHILFKKMLGLTLFEVVIALFIMSIGLLAVARMQILGVKEASSVLVTLQALTALHSLEAVYCLNPKTFAREKQSWQQENQLFLPALTASFVLKPFSWIDLHWFDLARHGMRELHQPAYF